MASVITDSGDNWIADRLVVDGFSGEIDTIAVGDGNSSPSESNTSLNNELYRADENASNVTLERTTNTGEIRAVITVTGGSEVPAGSEIYEIGVLTNGGTLIYHEVRSAAVTVENGETITFEVRFKIAKG